MSKYEYDVLVDYSKNSRRNVDGATQAVKKKKSQKAMKRNATKGDECQKADSERIFAKE